MVTHPDRLGPAGEKIQNPAADCETDPLGLDLGDQSRGTIVPNAERNQFLHSCLSPSDGVVQCTLLGRSYLQWIWSHSRRTAEDSEFRGGSF